MLESGRQDAWAHDPDRPYVQVMADRRACPSDLSDARWELIEPVLSFMNAILYVDRTSVQWRYLPHDFPHWITVYGYFAKCQSDGIFAQLNGLLRELVRQQEGRNVKPSACVIDAQSIKTPTSVPATSQGTDNAKNRGPQAQHRD